LNSMSGPRPRFSLLLLFSFFPEKRREGAWRILLRIVAPVLFPSSFFFHDIAKPSSRILGRESSFPGPSAPRPAPALLLLSPFSFFLSFFLCEFCENEEPLSSGPRADRLVRETASLSPLSFQSMIAITAFVAIAAVDRSGIHALSSLS